MTGALVSAPPRRPGFFVLLALPAAAFGFALSMQVAVLGWLLSTQYGLKIDEIALVWAAGPLAGIFAAGF